MTARAPVRYPRISQEISGDPLSKALGHITYVPWDTCPIYIAHFFGQAQNRNGKRECSEAGYRSLARRMIMTPGPSTEATNRTDDCAVLLNPEGGRGRVLPEEKVSNSRDSEIAVLTRNINEFYRRRRE